MSAEILRQAAALMRDRAEGDGSAGWMVTDGNEGTEYPPLWMVTNDAFHNPPDGDAPWLAVEVHTGTKQTAEHIASWHPDVALAVANWLECYAEVVESGHSLAFSDEALAVARAYLGGDQ